MAGTRGQFDFMKYTRPGSGEVVEVKGCTSCPWAILFNGFIHCHVPTLRPDGKRKPRNKKLVGRWTGAYHESCPLASSPENVPALEVKK